VHYCLILDLPITGKCTVGYLSTFVHDEALPNDIFRTFVHFYLYFYQIYNNTAYVMGCFSYVPRIDDITVPAQALYSTFISVYRIEVKKEAHFQIYIKNERIWDSVSAVVVSADVVKISQR